jgi:hypothetical protein
MKNKTTKLVNEKQRDIYCGNCKFSYYDDSFYIEKKGYKCKIDNSIEPSFKAYRSSDCIKHNWKE